MRCDTVRYDAIHPIRYDTIRYDTLRWVTVDYNGLQWVTMDYRELWYREHWITMAHRQLWWDEAALLADVSSGKLLDEANAATRRSGWGRIGSA